ncbi:aryl-alcohol dehydrogenase-like predicted oxidoreductase [Chitinophaga niastensis]|uniref:Aryl-alcohol dehydrogenase-like predicted oxidoreductase n=1 Tax=Chitinophaga niastensis TaxID=536980 RepID=A0A2P8HLV3_CHINA|nr:aldo/keto reductase [Chitinophaga niastensis]PSL47191.1 aryl-alcohol dehydrogenase-like predicted oxidoreductase [Chitinophaga niastensis]
MQYHLLGKSTLSISEIGFGCMSLRNDDVDNARLIHHALNNGINFFDTADLYEHGQNEITVGRALQGKRQSVIIATKVGNQWKENGSGWDWNPGKKYILAAVEDSLKRLQTDYIDLYQLHGGTIHDPIDDTIAAFETLQQQGKIRYYGISSIRPNVIRAYVQRSNIVSVMMQYSLLDRRPEETCFSLLQQNNIGVLARGSIARGLLVNKPAIPYLNYDAGDVAAAAAAINKLAGPERDAAQTALCFVLQQPAVSSAIVGIRTMAQLEDALKAVQAPVLKRVEIQQLQQALPVNTYEEHR